MAGAAKYQPYPAYKPSGVEWLGNIPEGWSHAPLKYMALEEESLFLDGDWIESKDLSDDGIRYITTGNVGEGAYKEQGGGYISEETFQKINASEVFEGDILVSRLNPPIGRACIVPNLLNRVVTSVDNVIFRPDTKFHRGFVVYMLSSREYFGHTSNMARGATMQRISRGLLGNIRIVFPAFPEQTKIAAFLDYEAAKIDALIAKQQRLIALLEEKRQAVISHAVTKGLDPTAPPPPSGIDWLGDVPAHWKTTRIKFEVSDISDCLHTTPTYDGDLLYPAIRTADVSPGTLDLVNARRVSEAIYRERIVRIKPQEGDILYSREGERFGMAALVPKSTDLCLGQRMMMFRTIDALEPRFFMWSLNGAAILNQVLVQVSGSTSPHINISDIKNFAMTLPPLTEQVKISDHIDEMIGKCDQTKNSAQVAITLLKERRTALISAAVTGKIDLRGWEAPSDVSDSIQDKEVLA